MNERTSRFDTPVLIAGSGPIGLALAGDAGKLRLRAAAGIRARERWDWLYTYDATVIQI